VPGTQERIIAAGQVVWTDELKKVGGLSLRNLAPDVRERVRGLVDQQAAPAIPQANTGPLNPDELTGIDRQETAGERRDGFSLLLSRTTFRRLTQGFPPPGLPASTLPNDFVPAAIGYMPSAMHQSRPHYMRGAATGILISIFALMIFVFLQNFRPESAAR